MKTRFIIAFVLFSINSLVFSQLTLVNTDTFYGRAGFTVLEGIGEKYFTVKNQLSNENESYHLKIYNLDHSIYKEINFDFPEDIHFSDFTIDYVSTRLFNLDDKIEFVVKGDCSGFAIFDEDGDLIFISEESNGCRAEITNTSDKALLFLPVYSYPDNRMEIYELPGKICYEYTPSTDIKSRIVDLKNTTVFPNPAHTEVTIIYDLGANDYGYLNVYNQSGLVVKTVIVNKIESSITINISQLSEGIYIYEIRSANNQLISESNKFIVN